ncbi:MAG: flagellar assembly peptidoglycan hydrolase FlgJ, partial [Gammaproteobacteria bacterium]
MAFNPISADLYTDFAQFSSMKAKGGANSPETVTKVARQFESLLVQMVLKSMREATLGESLLDSDQSDFYRDLYDKQLAIHLTRGSGLGLADLITRQLGDTTESNQNVGGPGRELGDYRAHPVRPIIWQNSSHAADRSTAIPDTADAEAVEGSSTPTQIASRDEFIAMLRPHAMQAGRELGVHPGVLLAQAALESGWGAKRIRHADGVDTYNLFGIKADSGWQGRSAVNSTLEYDRGIPVRQHARFRSY